MKVSIHPTIVSLLTLINNQGYEAYLVGGAVRDSILNKPNNDYDICTNMPLHLIKEIYPNFHLMKPNNHRNTGVIRLDGLEIEISEFKGHTIAEDLSNRDFTINAMALDKNGNLIDPYNGLKSLQEKKISLIDKKGKIHHRTVTTKIVMKHLTQTEIEEYVQKGEWHGVAGYKIEGMLAGYVKKIIGSYSSVVGLPLYETKNLLNGVGIN